jgi:two-component system chemotaxis response regulator CheY
MSGIQAPLASMSDILVVDDSKVMRDMIVACLRADTALEFTQAASGLEAIEQLSLKHFDLVVLDLNMPDIGGIEVTQFVRSQPTSKELPIVIVTTRGDEASRARALEAGASRYMTKPFTPEEILVEVRALLAPRSHAPR